MIDLVGKTFTRLKVVARAESSPAGSARWRCTCECGAEVVVSGTNLRKGLTKSCGCLRRQNASKLCHFPHKKPAKPAKSNTPEYKVWMGIRSRTSNDGRANFAGVALCDRWQDFSNFLQDVGPKPGAGYVLWRLDKSKGYSPENCIWSTREIEARKAAKRRRYGDFE